VFNVFAGAAALVALHLNLLEHAGGQLVAYDPGALSIATAASVHLAVGGTCARAVLANLLLVPFELGGAPDIEVAEGDSDLDLEVLAPPLLLVEVATAAEEAAEDVKRVVGVEPAAALLLMLLQPLVAILVVDAPAFGVAEGLVGFRNLDELVVCC